MKKIVPASRRVTEASWEPPSSPRRRAMTPAGEAVADCVSITATRVHPRNAPRGGGDDRMYQPFVKIRLDCGPPTRPSRQATPCDETLPLGVHQPNQTAEALAVFRGEIPAREETHAMFDDPALAFNQ